METERFLTTRLAHIPQVLEQHQRRRQALQAERVSLNAWLERLTAENVRNPDAPVCQVRMDAGFASGTNLAWLIEMGYIPVTKALSDQTTCEPSLGCLPVGSRWAIMPRCWAVPNATCMTVHIPWPPQSSASRRELATAMPLS